MEPNAHISRMRGSKLLKTEQNRGKFHMLYCIEDHLAIRCEIALVIRRQAILTGIKLGGNKR